MTNGTETRPKTLPNRQRQSGRPRHGARWPRPKRGKDPARYGDWEVKGKAVDF
jgi:hypothetical protein